MICKEGGFEYETIRTCDSSAVDNVCGSTAGGPSGTEIKKALKKIKED
jgi:hypothetical protein